MKGQNLEITRNAGTLEITYVWRTPMAYFLLLFCVIWDVAIFGFLLAGAGIFILFHLLVGAGLTYYTICLLFNRTDISVSRGRLTVTHGPVPGFRRNHEISAHQVRQLYVQKGGSYKQGNKRTQLWRLSAELEGGKEIHLLQGLSDKELALATERDVEDFLGIEDVARTEPGLRLPDLEAIRERMPAFIRTRFDHMTERAEQEAEADPPESMEHHPRDNETTDPEVDRPHLPHETYDFALCHAAVGAEFRFDDRPAKLTDARDLRWSGGEPASSRVLQVQTAAGGTRQFYATPTHGRWQYFEERPLDVEEMEMLEFKGSEAPPSLRNGDDRYYPHPPREGAIRHRGHSDPVTEYLYTTTRGSTRFRAVLRSSGAWSVFVQEPIDASHFEPLAE